MASLVCKIMGVAFLVIAVWGFITGHEVLIFHVNTAHNVVHLLSGAAALACGFAGEPAARIFSIAFGLVYALVAGLGFANVAFAVDLLRLNEADNWLHAGIAAVFLVAGVVQLHPARAPALAS
jgi:hypothetical protein